MNKFKQLLCSAVLMYALGVQAQNVSVDTGKYTPSWDALSDWECPEWFMDAKFGIWAHWGPQCEAECGDWYARGMYYPGFQMEWHKSHFGDPKTFGFKDVCNAWKAEEWNPDALVKLYKEAGAKYFMALGQHHDNFDLWNSPYQEWNSVNIGPKKDLLKGWSDACKKYDLPLGVSMHGSHTWLWMEIAQDFDGNLTKADGKGKWWEGYDPQELYAQRHTPSQGYRDQGKIHSQWGWQNGASILSEEYMMKFQNRVLECINDYNPAMLYFDDTVLPFVGQTDEVGLNILTHFYNHQLRTQGNDDVVVMGKILESKHKEALLWDVERGIPSRPQEKYWQTCTCIGGWHYSQYDYERGAYKRPEQVINMLVDIVSKNGNLLLSIPLKGNGTLDEKEMKVVQGITEWMKQNGTSIYGTRVYKCFGEGPLAESDTKLNAQGFNEGFNYTDRDVRYVHRNDTVYATIMRWPSAGEFTFKTFGYASETYDGKVKKVTLLGHGEVPFTQEQDGLKIQVPAERCNPISPVFEITFAKDGKRRLTSRH